VAITDLHEPGRPQTGRGAAGPQRQRSPPRALSLRPSTIVRSRVPANIFFRKIKNAFFDPGNVDPAVQE
jgi:hypothetical protein